jgi:hypothetical protein
MPTWTSFKAYGDEWDKVAKNLDASQRRKITREMAEEGQRIADRAATRDLGSDRAFSGWDRGRPIPLDTHLKAGRNESTLILPKFPGGWTVAEQGRNQGNARGFAGPGINVRTGLTARTKSGALRKVRVRKSGRWNGVTSPKHTASDAVRVMERDLPKIAERQYRAVLVKHFDVT